MIKKIGRKIYFLKNTGEVLYDSGEAMGVGISQSTFEKDITNAKLQDVPRDEIDFVQLKYGENFDDFNNSDNAFFKVNLETRKLEFFSKEIYRMKPYNNQIYKKEYSKEKIHEFMQKYLNVNIANATKLDKVTFNWKSVDELNIRTTILDKSWVSYFGDDFLSESARDRMKLAKSILENGTYWTLVTARDEDGELYVYEGNHRVISAKIAVANGEWDPNRKFLCMELDGHYGDFKVADNQIPLNGKITQCYPTATLFDTSYYEDEEVWNDVLKQMSDQGMEFVDDDKEIVERDIYTYTEFMYSNQIFPHWLRDILYNYKEEHGEYFPTLPELNDEEKWNDFVERNGLNV